MMTRTHSHRLQSLTAIASATIALAITCATIALVALAADSAPAASSASSAASAASGKERAARAEAIPGKTVKRVILSARAAERAGIEQSKIVDQPVAATQMFGAMVIDAASAVDTALAKIDRPANLKGLAVRFGVSPTEAAKIDRTRPARVVPLDTRAALKREVTATLIEQATVEVQRSGMVALSYAIEGDGGGLVPGTRVRIELPLQGSSDSRKTVPYSSIHYDAKGDAWVYVVTAPLEYVRERVDVERVAGSLAVLSKAPDAGTPVVTVGVSLLYGVEVFGK